MSFWGATFVFDGRPSELYSLYIASPDGGSVNTTGSSDVELYVENIYKKSRNYLLGTTQSPALEFDVSFNSPREITSPELGEIQAWLFGHSQYKKLQIVQSDMHDVYFNCFLKSPRVHKVGNIIRGIRATVVCDSPFAWTFPRTKTFSFTDADVNQTIDFFSISDDNDYYYPSLVVTMNEFGGDFNMSVSQDNGRLFEFTSLVPSEILTINNDLGIISSSTALKRLSNFNKNWFRLVRGKNSITFTGAISQVDMTYQFAKKMGG